MTPCPRNASLKSNKFFTKEVFIMYLTYSFYELLWLFFIYSFLGWVLETCASALRRRHFANRGLVNAPFCILYGTTAVFITLFCGELHGFWLFGASMLLASISEWIAGHLIELLFHKRWWDYSHLPGNLDGYICLPVSLLWGVLGFLMMQWGNRLLFDLFRLIPAPVSSVLLWTLGILLLLDITASLMVSYGKSRYTEEWRSVDNRLSAFTARLAAPIYRYIDARILKAYPQAKPVASTKKKPDCFAQGCCPDKIIWLFLIGAFLGDITETLYCRVVGGVWMSRSSVVWGPFSIVWGLAIAIFTLLLYKYRNSSDRFLFLTGTLLGGAYEYACSVFTELVFGQIFWDYSALPFNLGGRINLLYCFFWGIAAVVWMKFLYPKFSALIEKIPMRFGRHLTRILIIFMLCNITVSCMALARNTERANGIPATHSWQQIMDERFDDARMDRIYPNAKSANP